MLQQAVESCKYFGPSFRVIELYADQNLFLAAFMQFCSAPGCYAIVPRPCTAFLAAEIDTLKQICPKLACRPSELVTSAGQADTEPCLGSGCCWCTYKAAPASCFFLRVYWAGRPVSRSLRSSHRLCGATDGGGADGECGAAQRVAGRQGSSREGKGCWATAGCTTLWSTGTMVGALTSVLARASGSRVLCFWVSGCV
jgi:hypothetical protein